jgi:hypothetical protein
MTPALRASSCDCWDAMPVFFLVVAVNLSVRWYCTENDRGRLQIEDLQHFVAVVACSRYRSPPGFGSPPPWENPKEKEEVLAKHETLAIFEGVTYRLCMGLTPRRAKQCGDSGEFAAFGIKKYL